jgi:hypothetical protein
MAARAFMEQVRTVILQRRVRETQSRSEPAGAFQSRIAHITERVSADVCDEVPPCLVWSTRHGRAGGADDRRRGLRSA